MKARKMKLAALWLLASSLSATASVSAQVGAVDPASGTAAAMPASAAVSSFYNTFNSRPIWFRGPESATAIAQLVSILQRAPFDGFAAGPQLAQQVQAAIAQASSGRPDAVAAADRTLSTAWVEYVQAVKRPTPGMDYIYPYLKPQGTRADQILMTAAAAPSLARHLAQVSSVNAVYGPLRDAAWAQAQNSGNLTPDPRLLVNLDRARSIPSAGKFAVVDVGSQRIFMFENGQPVDSMKVIVGTTEFPTPLIASTIYYITLNPYWDSPDHLVRRAIAPKTIAGGMKYFNRMGYEVMADWTENSAVIPPDQIDWKAVAAGKKQIRVRQKPGPDNFMAKMKIPFPNHNNIYLHDTPTKALFAKAQRDLSNGCIRLEDASRFARWLMGGYDPVASSSQPELQIPLKQPVPLYVTYLTAQPSGGKVTYTADFYGWDKSAANQVATR
ncbi:MAG TPA: L,D-transpeptidase family protein [Sphingomicrobium sp.]